MSARGPACPGADIHTFSRGSDDRNLRLERAAGRDSPLLRGAPARMEQAAVSGPNLRYPVHEELVRSSSRFLTPVKQPAIGRRSGAHVLLTGKWLGKMDEDRAPRDKSNPNEAGERGRREQQEQADGR